MQREITPKRRLLALAAMVILTATSIPLASGFAGLGDRSAAPIGCPPSC